MKNHKFLGSVTIWPILLCHPHHPPILLHVPQSLRFINSYIRRNAIGIDCNKIASVWIVSRFYDVTLPFSGPKSNGINKPNKLFSSFPVKSFRVRLRLTHEAETCSTWPKMKPRQLKHTEPFEIMGVELDRTHVLLRLSSVETSPLRQNTDHYIPTPQD